MIRTEISSLKKKEKNPDAFLYEDISWLMSQIDPVEVLHRAGIRIASVEEDEILAFCPDHKIFVKRNPSHPKWALNKKTGKTICPTEGRGSNLVATICRIHGMNYEDCVSFILGEEMDQAKCKVMAIENIISSCTCESDYVKDSWSIEKEKDGYIKRGFSSPVVYEDGYEFFMNPPGKKETLIRKETVDSFKVFQVRDGKYSGRVVIPFFQENNPVGFVATDIFGYEYWAWKFTDKKEYKKVLNASDCHLKDFLYNIDSIPFNAPYLIICEGAREVMKLTQEGFPYTVALLKAKISVGQIDALVEKSPECLIVMMDGDNAGRSAAKSIYAEVGEFINTVIVDVGDDNDPKNLDRDDFLKIIPSFG